MSTESCRPCNVDYCEAPTESTPLLARCRHGGVRRRVLASRSPTRAPAGFELGAGGRDVVLHGDGLDSPDHLDEVVNPGKDAVAVVLCHGADVLHEMRRGAG